MEFGLMLKETKVVNLSTGEVQEVKADSSAGAVVLAGLKAQGVYQDSMEFIAKFVDAWKHLTCGVRSVAFGDFTALL